MPVSDGVGVWPLLYNEYPFIDPDQPIGQAGEEGDLVLNFIMQCLSNLEHRIGVFNEVDPNSIERRLQSIKASVIDVTQHGVLPVGAPGASAGANSAAFAALTAATSGAAVFWFPPLDFETNGFTVAKPGQGIRGCGGNSRMGSSAGDGTRIRMMTTGVAVTLAGVNGARKFGLSVEGVYIENGSTSTNIGLKLKHLSHFTVRDVAVIGFRGKGGGLRAYNAMDGICDEMSIDFCGSANGSNLAAMYLSDEADAGDAAEDACNSILFLKLRMENISDRYCEFKATTGATVNKIRFVSGKFETSTSGSNSMNGPNDSTQAAFLYSTAVGIDWIGCDFTLQNRQTAYVLDTMHRLTNSSVVRFSSCEFSVGSGAFPKTFNYMITANGSGCLLALDNVWLNSGNSTAYPTQMLKGISSPRLSQKCVGFTPFMGGSKVATDWFTSAEWATGGVIA